MKSLSGSVYSSTWFKDSYITTMYYSWTGNILTGNNIWTPLIKDIILTDLHPKQTQKFLEYVLLDVFVWKPVF